MQTGAILLFTRYPVPGQVKSRLIPALGPQGAAALMHRLTVHTLRQVQNFAATQNISLVIYYAGGSTPLMQNLFGRHFCYRPQVKGDLGQRLLAALQDSLAAGLRPVVIIGSDCPGLSPAILTTAFARLQDHDLVLGPAVDGGYYLIGLNALHPELFQQISWGTDQVLTQTMQKAQKLGLLTALLPTLRDIDRPADLCWLSRLWG
mgnify:CR=1 FL=1